MESINNGTPAGPADDAPQPQGTVQPQLWLLEGKRDDRAAIEALLVGGSWSLCSYESPEAMDEALLDLGTGPRPDLLIVGEDVDRGSRPALRQVEILRKLRQGVASELPILALLSASGSQGGMLNAFEAGADDVIRKPFEGTELVARLAWLISREAKLRRLRQERADLMRLNHLAQVLNRQDELPQILRTLIDGVREELEIDLASVYLLDRDSGQLLRALPSNPTQMEGSPRPVLDLGEFLSLHEQLAGGKPVFLEGERMERLLRMMGGVHPPRSRDASAALFPMTQGGRLTGVLVILDTLNAAVGRNPRERAMASIVCDLAAVAVQRAELLSSLRQERAAINRWSKRLAQTSELFESVIDASPDAIVSANAEGEITVFSRAATRILGWAREEALGMDVRRLYPPGRAEAIMRWMRQPSEGGVQGRFENEREVVLSSRGDPIPVSISAAIIYRDGRESGTVGIFTDLRQRIQIEAQLEEATADLERNRRRAMLAELAGAAAHELNQPLTSLLSYAELLRAKISPEHELDRAVGTIVNEAQRVADIVRKIGQITEYQTVDYVGSTRIVDLERASEVFEDDFELPPAITEPGDSGSE